MPEPDRTAAAELARLAANAADEKFGADTVVIDVGAVLAITEYFVITSGSNPRQVRAIVDEVIEQVKEASGQNPYRVEGLEEREWVLIDFGEFVVHVFGAETRTYFDLERLWADCPRLEWVAARE